MPSGIRFGEVPRTFLDFPRFTMIPFLGPQDPFPPVEAAREEMNGLLAIGANLSPERLLDAYRRGVFPWGAVNGFPLWYSPDPRMVLFLDEIHISRSLQRALRRCDYEIRLDTDFPAVIKACATTPRPGQDGTWITDDIRAAYLHLHELGWAHSVEIYQEGNLAGGLYGLGLGNMFFGESMFSRRTNASKIAFVHLVRFLFQAGFGMIDCQMRTEHLASLGAREIACCMFQNRLAKFLASARPAGRWPGAGACFDWAEPWHC